MAIHKVYCGEFERSSQMVTNQQDSNPEFKNVALQFEVASRYGLNLICNLVKPIGRICKYPLLLRVSFEYGQVNHTV